MPITGIKPHHFVALRAGIVAVDARRAATFEPGHLGGRAEASVTVTLSKVAFAVTPST
jgi:hypothetical protein